MSAFAAMLSLGLPWRDWSLALASVSVSVQVWHLWPDAVSAPAPPTSERSMNEPHTKIQAHNPHIHTSWREHSHKYRSGQIQVPSLNYNETIYLLPCSFLFKFRWMDALHKSINWLCEPCHLIAFLWHIPSWLPQFVFAFQFRHCISFGNSSTSFRVCV